MNLSAKVAYNTIIQFTSKIVATALGLAAIAFITRYLGQVGFGEYTTAITFISFFGIIADLGLTLVTVQIISQPGVDENRALGNLLTLRLVTAIIFLGLGPLLVLFFPYPLLVKQAVAIVALSFVFIALNQVLVGLFQKRLRLDRVSIAEVTSRLVLVIFIIAAVQLDYGLVGIMAATVLASAVNFLLHFIFARRFASLHLHFDLHYWRQIISRSWPLAITIVLNLIYLKTDTLLLSIIPRTSEIGIIAEVGIYGAAYKVIDVLITFPFMFAGIILPILTASWAEKNEKAFRSVLQKSFDAMAIMAIPLVIGTQLLARDIVVLVAGPEFALSGPVLRILIGAAGLIFLGVMFSHAVIAINKQRRIIGAYLFTAVTAVTGYFIVIPRYSYFGAAWVTIYSELAIALASFYLVWKYTRFFPSLKTVLKSLLASFAMVAVFSLERSLGLTNLFLLLSSAILTYSAALFVFGGLNRQDLQEMLNRN